MKLLFLSDTHWNLLNIKDEINFSNIDLIVLLWDNSISDLEFLESINIKKIWILWNNRFRWGDWNIGNLGDFWIEDISFKRFEFGWISFYWIDWNLSYQIFEDMKEKWTMKIFNPDIKNEIESIDLKVKDFFNQTKIDFLISHFPARWIYGLR